MIPIFYGKVKHGKVVLYTPERYVVHLAKLEGQNIELIVRKETKTRSGQQNRYYWGVVLAVLSECTGYDPEQMHDAMKEKFASKRTEAGLLITERTSKMDTTRFSEYIEGIKRWAAEYLECYIPDAGEVLIA